MFGTKQQPTVVKSEDYAKEQKAKIPPEASFGQTLPHRDDCIRSTVFYIIGGQMCFVAGWRSFVLLRIRFSGK